MAKRAAQTHCFAPGCTSGYVSSKNSGRRASLFSVPKEPEHFKAWQRAVPLAGQLLNARSRLCELHFDEQFIVRYFTHTINGETVLIPRHRPVLKSDAVPTIFPDLHKYLSKKARQKRKTRTSCGLGEESDASTDEVDDALGERIMSHETSNSDSSMQPDLRCHTYAGILCQANIGHTFEPECIAQGYEDERHGNRATKIKEEEEDNERGPLNMGDKDTCEPAAPHPRIASVTRRRCSTEPSRDMAMMDSNTGISGGTSGAPVKKPGRNAGGCHECSVCGQRFTRNQYLKDHLVLHTGEKPHACSICGRTFAQRNGLLNHQHIHRAEMRFSCELCPSKFCKKESFDRHKQLHASGVQLYHCHECSKVFESRTKLLQHEKWHKSEKPYPCQLCPAAFVYSKDLGRHLLVHTGERPYGCTVCQKQFAWKNNLALHMRRMHSGVKASVAGVSGRTLLSSPPTTQPPANMGLIFEPECILQCYEEEHYGNSAAKIKEEEGNERVGDSKAKCMATDLSNHSHGNDGSSN
ncbi:hypothetical protein HPB49_017929 [Dermacentor silvarum]|uniref:Uncharacterized protein n=1 Tax=Dermacentor silvarum TaxID=543639 RepID=A0ACB8DKC6_DERSI|nr:hypothetical protein HPB49_017929 [Dermacentor silvarum]